VSLPSRETPYRWLYLDLNSYFASVEQQENPDLRGKPVGVVPMDTDSTVLIAASTEAKKFGCRTLTKVGEAKKRCPQIVLVQGNHKTYADYHKRVLAAVESVLPIDHVCSIDELRIRLLETESNESAARECATKIKAAIRDRVGECMTCSIGLAPNSFLAKVASDMKKPDGLVMLHPDTMAEQLQKLDLIDFCGLNKRMKVRLNLAGIYTSKDMLAADRKALRSAFGSVVGERWWYLLRGYDLPDVGTARKSLGNSHVLSPEDRTREGSFAVLMRLTQKATARLRAEKLSAGSYVFMARDGIEKWEHVGNCEPSHDTLLFIGILQSAWSQCRIGNPVQVAVTFTNLVPYIETTPSIFDLDNYRSDLSRVVDVLNEKFGKNTILPAGLLKHRGAAEERIAFQKTELFDEGSEKKQSRPRKR
jgi:DNA polymerase-4